MNGITVFYLVTVAVAAMIWWQLTRERASTRALAISKAALAFNLVSVLGCLAVYYLMPVLIVGNVLAVAGYLATDRTQNHPIHS